MITKIDITYPIKDGEAPEEKRGCTAALRQNSVHRTFPHFGTPREELFALEAAEDPGRERVGTVAQGHAHLCQDEIPGRGHRIMRLVALSLVLRV